jgi:hypothetical protein
MVEERRMVALEQDTQKKIKKLGDAGESYNTVILRLADFCLNYRNLYEAFKEGTPIEEYMKKVELQKKVMKDLRKKYQL